MSVGSVTAQLRAVGAAKVSGQVSFDVFEPEQSLSVDGELRGCEEGKRYSFEIFEAKSCGASLGKPLNGGVGAEDECFSGKVWVNAIVGAYLADVTIGSVGGGANIVGHAAAALDGNDAIVACGIIQPD